MLFDSTQNRTICLRPRTHATTRPSSHADSAFGAAIRAVAVTLRYHMGWSMASSPGLRRPEPDPGGDR
jgi:hypothetical protein